MFEYTHAGDSPMPATAGDREYLRTNEAARAIGVSRQTLLRWFRERRVQDVKRDRNGWRLFSRDDVRRLREWAQHEFN